MKKIYILSCMLILCCTLYGCSQKPSEDTSNRLKGRYIEKNLPLPEETAGKALQLSRKDQKPLIYGFSETPFAITAYQLEDDGTWTEVTPAWLKSISSLPEGWSYEPQVIEGADGSQYLFYFEQNGNNLKRHLLRSKDGVIYEALHPEGWEEPDPDSGFYFYPSKITVLEDGSIAAIFFNGEVKVYSSTDQKLLYTIADLNYFRDFLSSVGTKLILGECDDNDRVKNIVLYDTVLQNSISYPFEAKIDSPLYSDHNNQNILLCNGDGIFKLEEGTSLWNSVLDGTLTSLAMPTMWSNGFTYDASENYYVLYGSSNGYSLMQYTFDKTVDTIPSNELNIYALTDNSTLRQAASIFQQEHTDVKVNFTTAMTREEYEAADIATREDYIRALNTELLAGSNYDILVLDGLPADSMIEKGVLADIHDLLQPMIEDGTLYKNIMDNYNDSGKIYRVPARFSVNMLFGVNTDVMKLNSLESLAEYASSHTDAPMFGSLTPEDLVNTFIPYEINFLFDGDGKISRDNLLHTLNALKVISDRCGIVESYDDVLFRGNNTWNMTRGEYLTLTSPKSFIDLYSFGMVKHVNGYYTSYKNSFTPSCELGINSKSAQAELAKEFLRLVLSEEIQTNDLYDGFPLNSKALIASSSQDRSSYSAAASVTNEDGSETMIVFEALDQKQIKDLVDICSSVSDKVTSDEHITAVIKEKAGEFFRGKLSAEALADAIIEKLNVYLSE